MRKKLQKKGILFDFDGVVVKSMEQHFEAWRRAFEEIKVQITPEEFFILEGQGVDTIAQILGKKHNIPEEVMAQVMTRKFYHYEQIMDLQFYDYFSDMLKKFNRQGVPMGIVTGGMRIRVEKTVEDLFNGEFQCLVTVDDVERGKPFPDPFLKGAQKLGLKPGECIVIENAPMGIEGAVKAGMTVIAITTTLPARQLSQAHFVVSDFREVEKQINSLLQA